MKTLVKYIIFFASLSLNAQVGFNTSSPDPSSTLDIFSNNMGVVFPQVSLTSYADVTTVPNPKESLIIYNTNTNLKGKQGYYFWNGTKWDYFINEINSVNIMYQSRYYSDVSSAKYTFNAPADFFGEANHVLGENITAFPTWTVVTDLTQNVTVDRANNQFFFTITGMIHANNTTSPNRIVSSFGFFIDDKLVDIKPISVDLTQNCTFREFTVYGVINNVSVGNHVVKFAIRNRTNSSTQSGLSITFGGKNPSATCTNFSDDEAKLSATIFINQPYEF